MYRIFSSPITTLLFTLVAVAQEPLPRPEWAEAIQEADVAAVSRWLNRERPDTEFVSTLMMPEIRRTLRESALNASTLENDRRLEALVGVQQTLRSYQDNLKLKAVPTPFLSLQACSVRFSGVRTDTEYNYDGGVSGRGSIGPIDFRLDYQWFKPADRQLSDQATAELSHEFALASPNTRLAVGALYFRESENIEVPRRLVPYLEVRQRWIGSDADRKDSDFLDVHAGLGCVLVFGGASVEESWGVGPKVGARGDFGILPWLRNEINVDAVFPLKEEDRYDPYRVRNYLYVPLESGLTFGIQYATSDLDLDRVSLMFEYRPPGRAR